MRRIVLLLLLFCSAVSLAQTSAPVIAKIDPPNWWINMPAPMLLVQGENFTNATFTLTGAPVRIAKKQVSTNGHWAILWLGPTPKHSANLTLHIRNAAGNTTAPYALIPRQTHPAGFNSADAMYLIMIDRFADGDTSNDDEHHDAPRDWHGGDLRGITQHLDYLQQLGITTVWITPVYQNHQAESYHGYGATDMYAVDEHFGKIADLRQLSAALHARGMKLVLDTVPNHVGQHHPWVLDSPKPDWFHGTLANHRPAQGDFAPLVDPHSPQRDRTDITEGWFANFLPDMNQENPAVAQYLTQNAIWWTEIAGLDGLRLDTFPYIARTFWNSFHHELHTLYPHLTTVGEIFNPDPIITSAFAGGVTRSNFAGATIDTGPDAGIDPGPDAGVDTGLDTPFDFPTYFALRDVFLKGKPMSELATILSRDTLYPHPERLVPFLGNHDTTRFYEEARRFGNEAASEATMRLAFGVLLTMRGMPQIYSGDEIAMRGGEDPDNRRNFPANFPGNANQKLTADETAMHTWVASLLALRKQHPALTCGEEQVLHADDHTLVIARNTAHGCPTNTPQETIISSTHRGAASTLNIPSNNTWVAACKSFHPLSTSTSTIDAQPGVLSLHLSQDDVAIAFCVR